MQNVFHLGMVSLPKLMFHVCLVIGGFWVYTIKHNDHNQAERQKQVWRVSAVNGVLSKNLNCDGKIVKNNTVGQNCEVNV